MLVVALPCTGVEGAATDGSRLQQPHSQHDSMCEHACAALNLAVEPPAALLPCFPPADGSLGDMLFFHTYKNPGLVLDIVQVGCNMLQLLGCNVPRLLSLLLLGCAFCGVCWNTASRVAMRRPLCPCERQPASTALIHLPSAGHPRDERPCHEGSAAQDGGHHPGGRCVQPFCFSQQSAIIQMVILCACL